MSQFGTYPQITTPVAADLFMLHQIASGSEKVVTMANLTTAITAAISVGTGFISAQQAVVITTQDPNVPNAQVLGNLGTGLLKNTTISGVLSIAVGGVDYGLPGNYVTGLTGDVTASGPGSAVSTISALAITNAKIANATIDLTTKVTGVLPSSNGGTGVANPANITIGAALTFSGAFAATLTVTGTTTVTLPATGTLATLAGVETWTNKTLTSPKIGTSVLDTNGNVLFALTATASALNSFTYANGATTVPPTFTAAGETNVGFNFIPKGTGDFIVTPTPGSNSPHGITINHISSAPLFRLNSNSVNKSAIGVASGSNALVTGDIVDDLDILNIASKNINFSVDGGTSIALQLVASTGAATFKASVLSKSATGGVGYTTGSGGTIAQASSRTTGVTLNTVSGDITLVSAAGSATAASFTVTNSSVGAHDTVSINQVSGTDLYNMSITAVAAGSFRITFFTTGGTTVETPVFHFNVIKGSNT